MKAPELSAWLTERAREVEANLALLESLDGIVRSAGGKPGARSLEVTPQQHRVLCASVYVQLYNLVEASVTQCLEALAVATNAGKQRPHELSKALRKEWVRFVARTHTELSFDNRLASALDAGEQIMNSTPMSDFSIERGGGGNWDDLSIEEFSRRRLSLHLRFSEATLEMAKRHRRNDGKGALQLVRSLRNELAHGKVSFEECGAEVSVLELREIADAAISYLVEFVRQFVRYVETFEYLLPQYRPSVAGI
jgi:hypothetical protein